MIPGRMAAFSELPITPEPRRFYASEREKRRVYAIKSVFGLSANDFHRIASHQRGGCAICGVAIPMLDSGKKHFPIDHAHDTGEVRGILCQRCNLVIGFIESTPAQWLEQATEYLRNPPAKELRIESVAKTEYFNRRNSKSAVEAWTAYLRKRTSREDR